VRPAGEAELASGRALGRRDRANPVVEAEVDEPRSPISWNDRLIAAELSRETISLG
jgi:hypothetical protein